jgi:hypothetical protein
MADYKLVMYQAAKGPRSGVVVEEEVFDVAKLTGRSSYATTLDVLNEWKAAQTILDKAVAKVKKGRIKGLPLRRTKLLRLPAYPPPFRAGANYRTTCARWQPSRRLT